MDSQNSLPSDLALSRRQFVRMGGRAMGITIAGIGLWPKGADASRVAWRGEWPYTEFSRHMVPFKEILSGQIPRDGIKTIENPDFIYQDSAKKVIAPQEPVISVKVGQDARCYPLGLLMWHQGVNDVVGGKPLLISYSPLTDSVSVFERTLAKTDQAKALTFGVTGKLRQANTLLYDRQSESWWQQYDGRCVLGALTGERLQAYPARLESLEQFFSRDQNPKVMFPVSKRPDPVAGPKYGRNPYPGLDSRSRPLGVSGGYKGDLPAMERLVIVGNKAWRWSEIQKAGTISTGGIRLQWQAGMASPLDKSVIAKGREIGQITVQRQKSGAWRATAYRSCFAFALPVLDPFAEIQG